MSKKFFVFLFVLTLFLPLPIYADDEIYLGGDSIGIEVDYDGILVSGTYVFDVDQKRYDPSDQIQKKDIIVRVNGTRVHTLDELYKQLNSYQETVNKIPITVLRNSNEQDVTLTTVFDTKDRTMRSGIYVKDKIVGVGTLTYYDPSSKTYGALGHEIMDMDLKEIADVHNGSLFPAFVTSIQKAQDNVPGEKHANIDYSKSFASVTDNTSIGIYGEYDTLPDNVTAYEWAKKEEVETGQAYMYTVLEGETIERFSIQVTKVHDQTSSAIKGISFVVDDPRLLYASNGIVQGMSGSPIIQNNKIIGAVTHVVTSKPMNGYGVYIEWMLEQSRKSKQ